MQTRLGIGALLALALLSGCGGNPATSTVNTNINRTNLQRAGAALRSLTAKTYTIRDLGRLDYYWPGAFLSPGAGSIGINNKGQIVSAMNWEPYLWDNGSVSKLTGNFATARALNDNGQITGDKYGGENQWYRHAALWDKGTVTDLGTLSNPDRYNYSYAFGINNQGQVVGESSAPSTVNSEDYWHSRAFVYSDGKMTAIGNLGGYYTRAVAINNIGQVVGYGLTSGNQQTRPFLWESGNLHTLTLYPGGTYGQANALNDKGQIVGFAAKQQAYLFGTPPPKATLWLNGTPTDLGTLGGPGSFATGINNAGLIVGSAETATIRYSDRYLFGYYYGYYGYYGYGWYGPGGGNTGGGNAGGGSNSGNGGGGSTGGSNNVPPAPGAGNSGNGNIGFGGGGSGRAAPRSRSTDDGRGYFVAHAFVYDGMMFDLNELLPADSGWELTQANAINENGQIVGIGTYQGQTHGFLLTPRL